jgi:hypothetical protein
LDAPLHAKEVFSVDALMGGEGSYTFLHRDSLSAVVAIVVLKGTKEVIQLGDTSGLSAGVVDDLVARYSVLGPDHIKSLHAEAKTLGLHVVTHTLGPGDVCFVHGGLHHAAYNHQASLSLNVTILPEAAELDALMDNVDAATKGALPHDMKLGRGVAEIVDKRIERLGMQLQSACGAMAAGTAGAVGEVRVLMAGLSDTLVLLRMLAQCPRVIAIGLGKKEVKRMSKKVLATMKLMLVEP